MAEEETKTEVTEPAPEPKPAEPAVEILPAPEPSTAQPVEPLPSEPPIPSEAPASPQAEPSVQAPESPQEPAESATPPESVSQPESTPNPISQNQTSVPPHASLARQLIVKAREAIQFRKRKKLEKIMGLFLKMRNITNDDVEKLLHVSDATATRYLRQLEKEGRVTKQGSPNHASYSRI